MKSPRFGAVVQAQQTLAWMTDAVRRLNSDAAEEQNPDRAALLRKQADSWRPELAEAEAELERARDRRLLVALDELTRLRAERPGDEQQSYNRIGEEGDLSMELRARIDSHLEEPETPEERLERITLAAEAEWARRARAGSVALDETRRQRWILVEVSERLQDEEQQRAREAELERRANLTLATPFAAIDLETLPPVPGDRSEVRVAPLGRLIDSQHDQHSAFRHPYCLLCELRQGWPDETEQPDDSVRAWLREQQHGRIRRCLTLHGRIPEAHAPATNDGTTRLVSGADFLADDVDEAPLWGGVWESGEALMLVGPPGVGKSTLVQQVVLAAISEDPEPVLGMEVAPFDVVVYLAMDRPKQIQRSMRRSFRELGPDVLADRLIVQSGPPLADFAKQPEALLELVLEAIGGEVGDRRVVVIVDSLKDAAMNLAEDGPGATYNRARQLVLREGIEVIELHHTVKKGANGGKPNTLADVYGSAWLTAGAGSVALLWGDAGDPLIELRHLKSPAGEVGPLQLSVDNASGTLSLVQGSDLLSILRAHPEGLSAKAAALKLFDSDRRADVEKARRRLDGLVAEGVAYKHEAARGSQQSTVWTALTPLGGEGA